MSISNFLAVEYELTIDQAKAVLGTFMLMAHSRFTMDNKVCANCAASVLAGISNGNELLDMRVCKAYEYLLDLSAKEAVQMGLCAKK